MYTQISVSAALMPFPHVEWCSLSVCAIVYLDFQSTVQYNSMLYICRLKVWTLNCSNGIIELQWCLVTFSMCAPIYACVCLFLFLIYTHVHKQVHTASAVRCSGMSVPSGWLVCAKSNVSPKYAPANGRSLTITRPGPVGHGYAFLRSMFGLIQCFLVEVAF